jgi:hypothetical protein
VSCMDRQREDDEQARHLMAPIHPKKQLSSWLNKRDASRKRRGGRIKKRGGRARERERERAGERGGERERRALKKKIGSCGSRQWALQTRGGGRVRLRVGGEVPIAGFRVLPGP